MTTIVEKERRPHDYYDACFEDGNLTMRPYCACGNVLDEDYFCEKCNKRCHCNLILCRDDATLNIVNSYIRNAPSFSIFKAKRKDEA